MDPVPRGARGAGDLAERGFEPVSYSEQYARVPYLPLVRVPYYRFVGERAEGRGLRSYPLA
jgi:hypothetical protein